MTYIVQILDQTSDPCGERPWPYRTVSTDSEAVVHQLEEAAAKKSLVVEVQSADSAEQTLSWIEQL